ncbi:MAG: hypothetical protein WA419_13400 [Silvibacterium sp.]
MDWRKHPKYVSTSASVVAPRNTEHDVQSIALAKAIQSNSKGEVLLTALQRGFEAALYQAWMKQHAGTDRIPAHPLPINVWLSGPGWLSLDHLILSSTGR